MKIAITGTHGVGKTTLVDALKEQFNFRDYYFDVNVTRWVRSLGFTINEKTSDAPQDINMLARVAQLNSRDKILADRSIIDILAYSTYANEKGNLSEDSLNNQIDLFSQNIHKYDMIIFIRPEFALEVDEVRSSDLNFQKDIDFIIESIILEHNLPNVFGVTGTVDQRVEQVKSYYNFVKSIKEKYRK